MAKLPMPRDREVLERFYLKEEARSAIRESMNLTELQFNQVLWRARQRFAEILRRQGFAWSDVEAHSMDG
jgi:RNA polymerase sigma-70 factor (ECF subfamily)